LFRSGHGVLIVNLPGKLKPAQITGTVWGELDQTVVANPPGWKEGGELALHDIHDTLDSELNVIFTDVQVCPDWRWWGDSRCAGIKDASPRSSVPSRKG
jgi:hypothetical protein